jgi:hypothetical protein
MARPIAKIACLLLLVNYLLVLLVVPENGETQSTGLNPGLLHMNLLLNDMALEQNFL